MLTQNLPEAGSMSLHSQFSHEGSSAKCSYNTHTTTKGCGLIINRHLRRARPFFPVFCKVESGKWKVESGCMWMSALGFRTTLSLRLRWVGSGARDCGGGTGGGARGATDP